MYKKIVVVVIIVLLSSNMIMAENTKFNGNWWRTLTENNKVFFVTGLANGYWKGMGTLVDQIARMPKSFKGKYVDIGKEAMFSLLDKYSGGTYGQYVDGLDEFFKDSSTSTHKFCC